MAKNVLNYTHTLFGMVPFSSFTKNGNCKLTPLKICSSGLDLDPILPNMIYTYVKNESFQIFLNICKPNLAYFTSILQKIG
jgi:hypothetical protein